MHSFTFGEKKVGKHANVSKYFEDYCRFNGVYSRDNLPKLKDGVCVLKTNKVKEHIGSYCLLTEIQLSALILLESDILFKTY